MFIFFTSESLRDARVYIAMFFFMLQNSRIYLYYFGYIMILSHRESTICSGDHIDVRNQIYNHNHILSENKSRTRNMISSWKKLYFSFWVEKKLGNFLEKSWILMDFHWISLIFDDFLGFHLILAGFCSKSPPVTPSERQNHRRVS